MFNFIQVKFVRQLDLLYNRFKHGARRELTGCARASLLPDTLVRDLRSRTGHETVSIKEHYETGCVCAASVNGSSVRRAAWGRAEHSMNEKHSETPAVCAVF